MRIVIEIPEVIFESCKKEFKALANGEIVDSYTYAIATGTPLPKGHGDLIDRKALLDKGCQMEPVEMWHGIKYAPTIIEADKEESE